MARYIDADKLKAHYSWWANGSGEYPEFKKIFDTIIDVQPTADVVEVVRCKDCKYREGSACDYSAVYVRPNGYCQWGEKETDCDYERAVEQLEHDRLYEPTFNQDDGSM